MSRLTREILRHERDKTVSYEEFFPGTFGVGGVNNFLGEKNPFHTRKFSGKICSPIICSPKMARILPAEEILKPKISWRQEEILRGNVWIT